MGDKDLDWSDKFSTDIVSIDHQHQKLLFLSQNLLNVLNDADVSLAEKQIAFQDLVNHAVTHFTYEERIMRNIGYPALVRHTKEHDDLRKEMSVMSETVMRGEGIEDWKGLVSLVQVWVLRHIVSSDTQFREYIQREDDES